MSKRILFSLMSTYITPHCGADFMGVLAL